MALRLVVNANLQAGYSAFLMLRKEARAAYARYLASKASLRRTERRLGKLDVHGAGRGLPRMEIFRYNALVSEARLYREQMEGQCEVLSRYGVRLDVEMNALSQSAPVEVLLALIGCSAASVTKYQGSRPSMHDLVMRDRLEDTSSDVGPVLACLLAARGELLPKQKLPRQAFQMHHFDVAGVDEVGIRVVGYLDF
ncbi:hypothetical protein [Pseudomonas aeruginosa]|uniref:hypothetical protein n=1 Tax=Pseudomonas aeruginosa TaxID=287 RepID=UPI000FFE9AE9|nr:hypothetical protein [Pseudomonas aeruginosa]MBA5107607.1 hypothetical protein [Pseudomonas aeruginosa]MBD1341618.1 hypothetical protein [Pseudomonas aeruginosa]MDP5993420.1 hypothetical protein [Pseudomonas aeruginosa]HCE9175683.1 hypothetical protein [Pseudomonas aeruginosa]HEO1611720.1 hypothetical protein [Pseudomonas aeruginosa]